MGTGNQTSLFDLTQTPGRARRIAHLGVVVREVRCKSLLNRSSIDDYSFNCYVGCSHGCEYCYARYMQRFHPHDEAWGEFVDVKVNAVEVLARQLRRLEPGEVFTCSACDGWQPLEEELGLTRQCCRLLLDAGFRLRILTKNRLVLRDLDIFAGRDVHLGVTITAPDESWARIWEPRASSVSERLDVLKAAKSAALKTVLMIGPLLPGISDTDEALGRLFAHAAETDVDVIWTDVLNPRPRVWPSVQGVLKRHRPGLVERYRSLLFDPTERRAYERRLGKRIRRAASGAGVAHRLG